MSVKASLKTNVPMTMAVNGSRMPRMEVLVAPTALLALVDDRHAKERVHAVGDARDDARYITPTKFVLVLHYYLLNNLKPALRQAQGP